VEDTGTTNGTYVNNERIAALTRTPLPDGCVLSFGGPRQV
jgi:pSer/pThr/pTyr-binding forkhead associated (FHA) protein